MTVSGIALWKYPSIGTTYLRQRAWRKRGLLDDQSVDRKAQLLSLPSRATYKELTAIHPKAPVAYVCHILTIHEIKRTPAGPCHHFVCSCSPSLRILLRLLTSSAPADSTQPQTKYLVGIDLFASRIAVSFLTTVPISLKEADRDSHPLSISEAIIIPRRLDFEAAPIPFKILSRSLLLAAKRKLCH
ncbi:hypothetical protein PEBR_26721 [Penicillium brasilianum]|uniref:Uncharacterized protein n=1 Tax=Penicillium brasilianum TaxID=104259 RepID=A0A1S9RJI2_PENBI|nr:hypothetical protein PEBR_26721 [Penicillium brasilianum]